MTGGESAYLHTVDCVRVWTAPRCWESRAVCWNQDSETPSPSRIRSRPSPTLCCRTRSPGRAFLVHPALLHVYLQHTLIIKIITFLTNKNPTCLVTSCNPLSVAWLRTQRRPSVCLTTSAWPLRRCRPRIIGIASWIMNLVQTCTSFVVCT